MFDYKELPYSKHSALQIHAEISASFTEIHRGFAKSIQANS